ncbi:MAG: cyclodeaminase/cyclohydrolase family protein [Oscillospiraceae bacterium]|nr:cyclodeaminase/cyclohydrolase family protein [Oscillospiraceae bacterium]
MADKIKIEILKNDTVDALTAKLSDPEGRPDAGSAAASSAAFAAALLERAAREAAQGPEQNEKLEWYVRNTEILRSYMVKLIDEDVKCRGPLRRAMTEGDEHRIEASRQTAVSICLEIVNMMGKTLEMAEELLPYADRTAKYHLAESADLAYGASLAAGRYVLYMSSLSSDDTYQYVMRRENELTMQEQKAVYDRVSAAVSAAGSER